MHSGTRFDTRIAVAFTALVVDTNAPVLARTAGLLADAGYAVSAARSFAAARRQLAALRPDVLVTTVRLDGFNGIHLVIASRAQLPDLVAIVTHGVPDPVLQAAATAQGAFYLSAPIDPQLFLDLLKHALATRRMHGAARVPRRWPRTRVIGRVTARFGLGRGLIVDVSYGGAQLQLGQPATPAEGHEDVVGFEDAALHLRARRVWSRTAGGNGPWWYGVELEPASDEADRWRAFVDRLS